MIIEARMHNKRFCEIGAEDTNTVITNQQPKRMEVHHHPHVEKKSFKEYLLEGLMIFLAVSMGFIAENIREHFSDKAKEKEYMVSLIRDISKDSSSINTSITINKILIHGYDSTLDFLTHNLHNSDTA